MAALQSRQQPPPSPRLSSCSSIIASRLDALQLQLQEERKRRLEVERAITSFEASKDVPGEATTMPSLVRLTSAALKRNPPATPQAAECASQRSAAVASCSSSARPSVDGASDRSSKASNRDKSTTAGSRRVQEKPDPFQIPKRLKDPLPPQARGGSSNPMFGKRKVSEVDIYLAQARHEQRMQALHQFQLPDL